MGKGDQRTKRGKIVRGTFGKTRPKKHKKAVAPAAEKPKEESKPAEASPDEA
jgi:30S ribosomal protein S31